MENTLMGDEWKKIITTTLGVEPILINSSLVSSQNRERFYWTNLPNVKTPKDRKIMLNDIIPGAMSAGIRGRKLKGDNHYTRYFTIRKDGKSNCLVTNPSNTNLIVIDGIKRTITVSEAEIIQTLPEGYTNINGITKSSRYKMIGNGWTIDVISHLFKGLKKETQKV